LGISNKKYGWIYYFTDKETGSVKNNYPKKWSVKKSGYIFLAKL